MIDLRIGERVCVATSDDKVEHAIVLWLGTLPPEHVGSNVGVFAGIQFDNPVGKGCGKLGSVQYFQAKNGHAAFVPANMIQRAVTEPNQSFFTEPRALNAYDQSNRPFPDPIGTKPSHLHNGVRDVAPPCNVGAVSSPSPPSLDELVFESDDDLEEVLKVEETPKELQPSVKSKKKSIEASAIQASTTSATAGSKSVPLSEPEQPVVKESSTEWSVVASKIKKAPKQVRDQMNAPEKKVVAPVKSKTKIDKILEENPKFKSSLCNWYVQGHLCPNGKNCHYAHGESELRQVPKPKFKYKTQLCSFYAVGSCYAGSQCHYAHGLSELQR